MKHLMIIGLLLAGCDGAYETQPAPIPNPPLPTEESLRSCKGGQFIDLIGRPYKEVSDRFSEGRVRVLRPGDVMTLDYSEQRLNVGLDEQDNISSLRCG